jgi:hypothetical protein
MTHLLLAHLSKDNNDPQVVQQLFDRHAGGIEIIIASRYKQTAIYTIRDAIDGTRIKKENSIEIRQPMQLSLF